MKKIQLIKNYIKEQESMLGNMIAGNQLSPEFENMLKSNIEEAKNKLIMEEICQPIYKN